jgi:phospholipase/lecithinase/hemolysin
MKSIRSWAPLILVAALLTACGGGDPYVPGTGAPAGAPTTKGTFTALVSFGTSASDVGTYTPATQIPGTNPPVYFGGKFTTNSATGTVWVENLAATLGILVTPAEMGFNNQSVACPAAANPLLASTCTGYAQGGAMVTARNGYGRDPATGAGTLTFPLAMQIDNHLTRFGSFKDSDLIIVEGGLNDVFAAFEAFAAQAQQIQAQAQAGAISVDQANLQLFGAQSEAQAKLKQAAFELAGYVRTKILAHGGKYVAVATVPDTSSTPFGQQIGLLSRDLQFALAELTHVFNLWLREGLVGAPVRIVDATDVFNAVVADPAAFGMTNVTAFACDPAKISVLTGGLVTDGTPVWCNSTPGAAYNTMVTGASATTWFFADDVHPSTGGHKVLSDIITDQLKAFGWI